MEARRVGLAHTALTTRKRLEAGLLFLLGFLIPSTLTVRSPLFSFAGDETGGRKDALVFHDCVTLACNTIPRLASIACDAVAARAPLAVNRAPLLEVAAAATVASPTLYPEAVWRSAA